MSLEFSNSSEYFRKGIIWLENNLKIDKVELRKKRKELKKQMKTCSKLELITLDRHLRDLEFQLKFKYFCQEVRPIYILSKVNSNLASDFITIVKNPNYWEDFFVREGFFDNPHLLWYFNEMSLGNHPKFLQEIENLIKNQTVEGFIDSNMHSHSGSMRVLIAVAPESEACNNAVDYWLKNWRDFSSDEGSLSVGILALSELNIHKYNNIVRQQVDQLKKLQQKDGSWDLWLNFAYSLWAISRIDGIFDSFAKKSLKWIKNRQSEDGSWKKLQSYTFDALLCILVMGEGPTISKELMNNQILKLTQEFRNQKPIFLHTSPLYKGSLSIKQIYNKIFQMLGNAQKIIRISSPFIDMFYDNIIDLCQKNPNLVVKIVTRPFKDVKGTRERIAKNAVQQLNVVTRGNVVKSNLVHSRIVIIDEEELLISSADLTRDQLFDEFNAGIWTLDKETILKAIAFFDNLFQLAK